MLISSMKVNPVFCLQSKPKSHHCFQDISILSLRLRLVPLVGAASDELHSTSISILSGRLDPSKRLTSPVLAFERFIRLKYGAEVRDYYV